MQVKFTTHIHRYISFTSDLVISHLSPTVLSIMHWSDLSYSFAVCYDILCWHFSFSAWRRIILLCAPNLVDHWVQMDYFHGCKFLGRKSGIITLGQLDCLPYFMHRGSILLKLWAIQENGLVSCVSLYACLEMMVETQDTIISCFWCCSIWSFRCELFEIPTTTACCV